MTAVVFAIPFFISFLCHGSRLNPTLGKPSSSIDASFSPLSIAEASQENDSPCSAEGHLDPSKFVGEVLFGGLGSAFNLGFRSWNPRTQTRRSNIWMTAESDDVLQMMGTVSSAVLKANQAVGENIEPAEREDSFVSMAPADDSLVDEDGLPMSYSKAAIQRYWDGHQDAMRNRWFQFFRQAVPIFVRVTGLLIEGGGEAVEREAVTLARQLRNSMERLGPTFIKLGQVLSARPDLLSQEALEELATLQDDVEGMPVSTARAILEKEYGRPLSEVFASDLEPVRAGSLAQVFSTRLLETGEKVAVKVQRPGVRALVVQDMYALRRAALIFQSLVESFLPDQPTDFVEMFDEFAMGWYTELDFMNEGNNMDKMRSLLREHDITNVLIPTVNRQYTTGKVLVSEWVDGTRLSECDPGQIQELIEIGQDCFFTQLFKIGLFHADPHPGNLMRLNDQSGPYKLVLLDFGIVTKIKKTDVDAMISAVVHVAGKDYDALIDDFISLKLLPADCDRQKIAPLAEKTYAPYFKRGGMRKYAQEIISKNGMDATVQDFRTVFNEIPFSIPSYFGITARAIIMLEGVALSARKDYSLLKEVFKHVGVNLLTEGRVSKDQALKFILSDTAVSVRARLTKKAITAVDLLLRLRLRKEAKALMTSFSAPLGLPLLPSAKSQLDLPLPFLLPALGDKPARLVFTSPRTLLDTLAPKLTSEEEIYSMKVNHYVRPRSGRHRAASTPGDVQANPLASLSLLIDVLGAAETIAHSTSSSIPFLPRQFAPLIRQLRQLFGSPSSASAQAGQDGVQAEIKNLISNLTEEERTTLVHTVNEVSEALLLTLEERAKQLNFAVMLGQRTSRSDLPSYTMS